MLKSLKAMMFLFLKTADAILVPGGFGERGHWRANESYYSIRTSKNKIPFWESVWGMQLAVIEYASPC